MTNADGQMRDVVSPQCVSNALLQQLLPTPAHIEWNSQSKILLHCTARSYSTQLLLTIWQQHSVSSKYYIVVLLFGDCPEINRQRAVDSNPSSYRIGSKYYILDCTLLKIKQCWHALFLIQAYLNLKNQIFLKKRPPRSKTMKHQGHKGRKKFGWGNFFYLISRQIGQF